MVLLFNKWLLSFLLLGAHVHPYHVSATEIEYNAKAKRIEISIKVFTDDFENALKKSYGQRTDFSNAMLKKQMTELIDKYVTSNLVLKVENNKAPISLYGWEVDHEAVYVYATAAAPLLNPRKFTVENKILYNLFEDQINIIHFIFNGTRKSTKLVYPEAKTNFSF